jgi:uncharacterized membrane protein (DUF485 family)
MDIHSEEFLKSLMRRQLRLSLSIGSVFGLLLLAMPLANYFAPEFMATRICGFTLTWLILGVLFFPLVWILSWVFIRRNSELENEEARIAQEPALENEFKPGQARKSS